MPIPGNPKHGEPDHVCPADQIVEWRPTAQQLIDYQEGQRMLAERIKAMHLMAQLQGDPETVELLEGAFADIRKNWDQIQEWYLNWVKDNMDVEELKRQEFEVPSDGA